ncbi:hypothetical protein [Gloeothece verrucosa]|uniref:hypothetical protein n=1 Tax=Gloeothece verrucosa TaxID=2546359 RepID=UPI0002F1C25F|nr:hypothetical protein [Gloeothece verrucosa]
MDVGVAYAYVQGRWVKCISQYYSIFSGRSEKELFLASVEIKQLKKLTNISIPLSAQRLAEFLSDVQKHETLLMQRLRDLEAKMILDSFLTESPTEQEIKMPISNPRSSSIPQSSKQLEVSASNQATYPISLSVDVSELPIFEEYR